MLVSWRVRGGFQYRSHHSHSCDQGIKQCKSMLNLRDFPSILDTLQETNISPPKETFEELSQWCDM